MKSQQVRYEDDEKLNMAGQSTPRNQNASRIQQLPPRPVSQLLATPGRLIRPRSPEASQDTDFDQKSWCTSKLNSKRSFFIRATSPRNAQNYYYKLGTPKPVHNIQQDVNLSKGAVQMTSKRNQAFNDQSNDQQTPRCSYSYPALSCSQTPRQSKNTSRKKIAESAYTQER